MSSDGSYFLHIFSFPTARNFAPSIGIIFDTVAYLQPPDFDRTVQKICPAPIICLLLHVPDSLNAPLRCCCAPSSLRLDNIRILSVLFRDPPPSFLHFLRQFPRTHVRQATPRRINHGTDHGITEPVPPIPFQYPNVADTRFAGGPTKNGSLRSDCRHLPLSPRVQTHR